MNEILAIPTARHARPIEQRAVNGAILTANGYDNTIRWQAGARLQHLFERCCADMGDQPALDVDGTTISFAELDQHANQMARFFVSKGFGAGDRIGLIVDRSVASYVALLAVLKIDAAYVPLDAKFPTDRIAYIAGDARIKAFVTTEAARPLVAELGLPVFELNAAAEEAGQHLRAALDVRPDDRPADRLCYIIYTSGSTGRPKGVAVNHSSICNFVAVASDVYGYVPGDRVYQGMTLAFDFSVEELWVPLMAGATLVPSPADRQMVGEDLATFLAEKRITAMCCVPTLLATMSDQLPDLRLLLVSGEACPPDIVARWQQPGRRMLNAYGPTEATVTATWTEVTPDKAVTIGVPLPTYTVAILEVTRDALAEDGAVGEITIAGIGLAEGYVNRPDQTAKAFVPDFLQLANNPSRRLYRTGDLGRINVDGEIEYLGRIDTQVKIRGYRIELAEIENVLLEVEGISQAVVTTYEAEPGQVELAAYYTCFDGAECPTRQQLVQVMRSRLPGYMVPAFVEELDEMPLLASHKADRKALPTPSEPRLVLRSKEFVAPRNETEQLIAECLAQTLNLDAVSVDDHFFEDLGAHSLLMGQFLSTLNTRMPDGRAAISDVYLEPSVAQLAEEIETRRKQDASARRVVEPAHVASDLQHAWCGVKQAAFYVSQYTLHMVLFGVGVWWASGGGYLVDVVARAFFFGTGSLLFLMALPIAAKWLLIGRWREERIPIWSAKYFRFWAVKQLTTVSPWYAFRGTALFNVYLRLLGAKIGDGALILTERVPLATDLIDIGAQAVVRKAAHLSGYRAENGFIEVGTIAVGARALVGERAVVDAGTSIGDDAQLGHASALLAGQSIPAGQRWHGSPARETDSNFLHLPHTSTSRARRATFAAARLISVLIGSVIAIAVGGFALSVANSGALGGTAFAVWQVLVASLVLFVSAYVAAFIGHLLVPRVLRLMLVPGKVYPLYGYHHYVAEQLGWIGYSPLFQILFGDSSAIIHYFRWLGLSQPNIKQTGSNFGTATSYESPFEVEVGSGSMVSDGVSIINLEFGSGSFRLVPSRIGENCFLGNIIVVPPHARLGDNYLLGTKTMVPIDGKVRENVGLLGSPAFEIPREVVNGQRFNPVPTTAAGHARLQAKNAFNFHTALLHLTSHWALLFGLMLIAAAATVQFGTLGISAIVLGFAVAPFWVVAHGVVVERLSLAGFKLQPHNCTIHDPYFWRIERHWKLGETLVKRAFAGTPFRPMMLRLVGLTIGRKVYDDGAGIAEKSLVEIGDNCCINAETTIHGHSLEDGLFKSDRIVIGDGCTIGPAGFVHYGVHMGANTVLSPDAFLMKGATTGTASYWQGNPARVV
ncbi:MAG: non-ribosomal peptide synthetase-like protein [Hyphomicrobiaceae bacterium]|jgi:non-ribosomal peptide synthetase-like protein